MPDSLDKVNPEQMDIFREIGNIGAGNAATALASLLGRQINMSIPEVEIVPFNDIVNIMSGPETLVVGVLVGMSGGLNGYILLVLGMEDAYEMCSALTNPGAEKPAVIDASTFSELELSALTEISNILVGSYLSAICSLTGLTIDASVPQLAMDMVGAILSIMAIEYGQIGDSVLFLNTHFSDVEKDMSGHFFLIPDFESYKILMNSLGMEF